MDMPGTDIIVEMISRNPRGLESAGLKGVRITWIQSGGAVPVASPGVNMALLFSKKNLLLEGSCTNRFKGSLY